MVRTLDGGYSVECHGVTFGSFNFALVTLIFKVSSLYILDTVNIAGLLVGGVSMQLHSVTLI